MMMRNPISVNHQSAENDDEEIHLRLRVNKQKIRFVLTYDKRKVYVTETSGRLWSVQIIEPRDFMTFGRKMREGQEYVEQLS